MKRYAAWLAGHLRHIGMKAVRVAQTPGHPIVYAEWLRAPGRPTVLMGFALPDDRMHAPNEKFHLPNFFNGIATCISYLAEVAGAQDMRMVAENGQVARSATAW